MTGSAPGLFEADAPRPLADRMRPSGLDAVVGQDHLIGRDGSLRRMLDNKRLSSLILWGGPGCGKTTLARLLAEGSGLAFEPLSAVFSGVADLRKVFDRAKDRRQTGQGTLLFVDEIHRFNRVQQDSFLSVIEDGTVVLIGATTENPSFELNAALLSRCQVFVLNRLDETAMSTMLERAEASEDRVLPLDSDARSALIAMADGDGRSLLNMAEALFALGTTEKMTPARLADNVQRRLPIYDKRRDSHFNLISALHKSLRGTDCDAALYWFGRMLEGGEDPLYIARRLVRFAYEDIGLADPNAAHQALAAWDAYDRLGSPEGELALAQAMIYLATAPKSNAAFSAFEGAKRAARETGSLMPPKHILNAPTAMMKNQGYGKGYAYDHDAPDGFSGQNYFPDSMARVSLYQPVKRGFEREIAKRLVYWERLRRQRRKTEA